MIEQPSFHVESLKAERTGPVECLGMTFENDAARRAYFTEKLREKLQDPEFRKIEGFPIGTDEDIIALSDPPYYTACPSPFIGDFIKHYGRPYDRGEAYAKGPFAADVSEGKNDPVYNAHSYHTKVPHKAIMRYILHYTKPGDIILDGFCGTGMTGVAAQMCGTSDPEFQLKLKQEAIESGWEQPEWGIRHAILGDLSPAATFIAYNYNTPVDVEFFEHEATAILTKVERSCAWMYETKHSDGTVGRINYTVWTDVFVCPECGGEIVFWDVAVDAKQGKVREKFPCPHCNVQLSKTKLERLWESKFDPAINETVRSPKQVPVLINYSIPQSKRRYEKRPDQQDLDLIQKIEATKIPYWFPTNRTPEGFNTEQPRGSHGMTHVHHFYTKRNLWVLACLRHELKTSPMEEQLLCLVGDQLPRASKMHKIAVSRLNTNLSKTAGVLAGTLYVPANQIEYSVIEMIGYRIADVAAYQAKRDRSTRQAVQTVSANSLLIPASSIDYIFTDPPFGGNLMYSELNFLWEAWLKVFTNNKAEAIENRVQGKELPDYQRLMEYCFREYYRVLKPGRWMTVEFSNTRAAVWNAIQTALEQAGFVVANVAALDKQQGTIKAATTPTAVKQDLIISCYKPTTNLEARFEQNLGTEVGVWEFVQNHLRYLPVFLGKDNQALEIAERTPRMLYDRLVAYFVRHGYPVPISSPEFQAALGHRFLERDGMYFLTEQAIEYERRRMTVREVQQLQVFVSDESSAIQWLRQQLTNRPQTTSDLTPQFMKELAGWQKHEVQLELSALLEENFLPYTGEGPIPAQIVTWLKKSSELRELIQREGRELENGSLETNNPILKARAKDRWYVPDPNKAIDLEKLRLKGLLREFAAYAGGKSRLKQFRMEAVRAGFAEAWRNKDYTTIVRLAERLPESVLQEDPDLLMYYDNASLRVG